MKIWIATSPRTGWPTWFWGHRHTRTTHCFDIGPLVVSWKRKGVR